MISTFLDDFDDQSLFGTADEPVAPPAGDGSRKTIKVYQPASSASSTSSFPSFLEDDKPHDKSTKSTDTTGLNKQMQDLSTGAEEKAKSSTASNKIDLSKLGMLPKRQVSLVGKSTDNKTGADGPNDKSSVSESPLKKIPPPTSASEAGQAKGKGVNKTQEQDNEFVE